MYVIKRFAGVFSKAAKALRECPNYISTGKDALALKGIGKGIAGYIQEFLDSGTIVKLEELRAGTA
jgi:DNA polymerase/3'-5' exonuclease PolX